MELAEHGNGWTHLYLDIAPDVFLHDPEGSTKDICGAIGQERTGERV